MNIHKIKMAICEATHNPFAAVEILLSCSESMATIFRQYFADKLFV